MSQGNSIAGSTYIDMFDKRETEPCSECRDETPEQDLHEVGIETKDHYSQDLVCGRCLDKIHSEDELTNFNLTE